MTVIAIEFLHTVRMMQVGVSPHGYLVTCATDRENSNGYFRVFAGYQSYIAKTYSAFKILLYFRVPVHKHFVSFIGPWTLTSHGNSRWLPNLLISEPC